MVDKAFKKDSPKLWACKGIVYVMLLQNSSVVCVSPKALDKRRYGGGISEAKPITAHEPK